MTFLPIVDRELRVAARRLGTYRTRTLVALVTCVVITGTLLLSGQFGSPVGLGKSMFKTLFVLAFLYCCLAGIRNTADCLSEEKRGGTLGLLFLTDLKGYDVVLGKLLATSLKSFHGLLAVLPAFAISFLLGGVTGDEFWRMILVLINTLFLSLTSALCVSAISRDARRAWGGALAVMASIVLAPIPLDYIMTRGSVTAATAIFGLASPGITASMVFDMAYASSPGRYWFSLILTHQLGWLFLALACFILPRAWQTSASRCQAATVSGPPTKQLNHLGNQRPATGDPNRWLEINPVVWLVGRNLQFRAWLWGLVGLAVCLVMGAWIVRGGKKPAVAETFTLFSVVALHLAMRIAVASQACHSLIEAHSRALELLFLTPLKTSQIIQGQFLALKSQFSSPVKTMLLFEGLLLLAYLVNTSAHQTQTVNVLIIAGIAGWFMASFVADLFALGWVGMWLGLKSKKPNQALINTFFIVVAIPWLAVPLLPFIGIIFWVFSPIYAAVLINWARGKLTENLRQIATQTFEEPPGEEGWLPFLSTKRRPTLPPVIHA